MKLFGGASNQELVKKIAELGVDIGEVNISKFANDEKRVSVGKGSGAVAVLQSFSTPVDEQIIEFCLLSDALTRAGYSELVGVVPWLGYSKQDKVFLPGEALSAKVIAQIIQTTKIKKLITFDLHNRAITGFFDIPVVELSAKPLFRDYFITKIKRQGASSYVVVAPDEGAVKASAAIARELGVGIAYMDKRRDLATGEVSVVGMSGEVSGKNVIIVDDMIVTGSTMMESAAYLKKMGAVSVVVAATHHLYLAGVQEKLERSEIDEVIVSDTVQMISDSAGQKVSNKLRVLSVASLIVDELS